MRYVLDHTVKYIRPLQEHGSKVCISLEGGGSGLGFCNLTDEQIADFVAQVKAVIENYELDGINLWDRNAGYGKEGMPAVNTTSYPKLIKAMRESLGSEKLLTLTVYEEPTESFGIRRPREVLRLETTLIMHGPDITATVKPRNCLIRGTMDWNTSHPILRSQLPTCPRSDTDVLISPFILPIQLNWRRRVNSSLTGFRTISPTTLLFSMICVLIYKTIMKQFGMCSSRCVALIWMQRIATYLAVEAGIVIHLITID